VFAIFAAMLVLPALLVAVMLGPVVLGILCAVGCALLVVTLANFLIGLGLFGRSVERAGVRYARHTSFRTRG
jgi:hypothetical protein